MTVEERLIQEAILGDKEAFEALIAPYAGKLKAWLGYVLDKDAEDCLQDVLLSTWLKLSSLNDPKRFRGWFFQLARNRSLDILRKRKRMDQSEISFDLVENYLGHLPEIHSGQTFEEWNALLTDTERTTIRLYYIDELTIDQIAKQRAVSTGTVKRILFNARNRIRKFIITSLEGEDDMSAKNLIFMPEMRPLLSIKPIKSVSFEVDFREDPWYFSLLEAGNKTQWAIYDPPTWKRSYVYNMKVIGKAVVHGEESFEIQVDEYENGSWKENSTRHYTQLGDTYIKYLAVLNYRKGIPNFDSFLDEQFHENWGKKVARFWKDEGRFQEVEGNHYKTVDPQKTGGLGFFDVTIGENTYPCLRVLDTDWAIGNEGWLVEAFLSREGRTVLFRRYNSAGWRSSSNWVKNADDKNHIVLDGVKYIHWYDCISDFVIKRT